MMMEQYDIKNDLEIGKQIFENVPNGIKPDWAGLILLRFDNYIKNIPDCVAELYSIIDNEENWGKAHNQFSKIRTFGLENTNFQPTTYLALAEKVAKVTFNASGSSVPFDYDSGHYIPSLALKVADYFNDDRLEKEIKSTILIFNRNKKLKDNLSAARDLFKYKKIDDILWFDWDPLGVNDTFPRDEYQGYVPEILMLLQANANRQEIADKLFKLETEHMGMSSSIESCLKIADKILRVK